MPLVGLYTAAVLLLVVAGLAKLKNPFPTHRAMVAARLPGPLPARLSARPVPWIGAVIGAGELAVALVAVSSGRWGPVAVAVAYLALAGFAGRILAAGSRVDCGCFGSASSPTSGWHVAVNLGFAAVAGALAGTGWTRGQPLYRLLAADPVMGALLVALAGVLTYAAVVLMTAFPELQQARRPGRRRAPAAAEEGAA